MSPPPHPPSPLRKTSDGDVPGLYNAENISLDVPAIGEGARPPPVKYMSAPAYQSPVRHHRRAASTTRHVKETLNARSEYSNSEDDGTAQHRINQYLIKQEIGRGSFGAVHLAIDQYNQEYAVKEFSKSRLRKRAQSNLLRRPSARRRRLGAGVGFNSPLHRHSTSEENNALDLIKEEIAIMKKLNHPNVVSLIEVLDDPEEDSLYMVMEMCKKGVVMQVGLEERADPYSEEQCRCWFRDMILGMEYLHAQGIVHRDIKPDNCLVTDDDVLKIVDFGVSEMFEKQSDMMTAKSAGSPAFMPPELCVAKHGHVSGRAADIWSMGVTLYCLLFGRIPFEKMGMLELYDSIRNDNVEFDTKCSEDLVDLLHKLLEKDPERRIKMDDLREHPWVTRQGTDPLLSVAENVAIIVEPPTDEEVNAAITGNMGHLVTVVRAVKRFKQLLFRRRPDLLEGILGSNSRIVQPPLSMRPTALRKSQSQDTDNRRPMASVLTTEGIHQDIHVEDKDSRRSPGLIDHQAAFAKPGPRDTLTKQAPTLEESDTSNIVSPQPIPIADAKVIHESSSSRPTSSSPTALPPSSVPSTPVGKGQAHDPLQDHLFLHIGIGGDDLEAEPNDELVVSESPSNVEDMNVYERAYQEEISRILTKSPPSPPPLTNTTTSFAEATDSAETPRRRPTLYLTRRVENIKSIRENENIFDAGRANLKGGIKLVANRAKKEFKEGLAKGEAQRAEGRETLVSRGLRNVKGFKDMVDEAREIVREEERKSGTRGDRDSRSGTPVSAGGDK